MITSNAFGQATELKTDTSDRPQVHAQNPVHFPVHSANKKLPHQTKKPKETLGFR